jgi:hypothetical protein
MSVIFIVSFSIVSGYRVLLERVFSFVGVFWGFFFFVFFSSPLRHDSGSCLNAFSRCVLLHYVSAGGKKRGVLLDKREIYMCNS